MIVIPSRLVLDDTSRDYSLGSSNIALDESDVGRNNDLFKLMIKYLVSPSTADDFINIERNLKYYLDYEFMQKASEQMSDFEWDREEYKGYVNDAWKTLSDLAVIDFLEEEVVKKLKITKRHKSFTTDDLKYAISNIKGVDLTVKDYLNSGDFATILGTSRASKKGRKIRSIAQAKSIYTDALDEINDYISIKKEKEQQINAGGYSNVPGNKITYEITVNTKKMFTKIFKDAGIDPQMGKLKKAIFDLVDMKEDWNVDPDNRNITPEYPELEYLIEAFELPWLPKDLAEKSKKDEVMERFLVDINLKLMWEEIREEVNSVTTLRETTLSTEESDLIIALFNAGIVNYKQIIDYLNGDKNIGNRRLSATEIRFFNKHVNERIKSKTGFSSELEENLYQNLNQTKQKIDKDIIVHAPDSSKHNSVKLFNEPIPDSNPVIAEGGLESVKEGDISKEFHSMYKDMLNPTNIGIHTLKVEVIKVPEVHIQAVQLSLDQPTMPNGISSAKNKKEHRELLNERWNVFILKDADYKGEKVYFMEYFEYQPAATNTNRGDKFSISGYASPRDRRDRSDEGGEAQGISVTTRTFHSSVKRQLEKLKRYIDG
tara:strand:- start:1338 stop:3140 length:1803 start_codon:yes stop_codon:yes gene_type:complete